MAPSARTACGTWDAGSRPRESISAMIPASRTSPPPWELQWLRSSVQPIQPCGRRAEMRSRLSPVNSMRSPSIRCWPLRTDFSHVPRPAAIADVLKLEQDAVGIGEVKLGRPVLGPAALRAAHGHVGNERGRLAASVASRLHAEVRQLLEHLIGIETFHPEAHVIDVRLRSRSSGAAAACASRYGEKLTIGTDR